ncbi:TRAP transporter substrate-binding protein DctP [Lysinibacillus sp. KU-BSD001]|uniref:TRAP transporter substrate-binding protein n=1 Tax=Lysinibacillus sp. KU-BSD001 TaxID=3141328 RepID=UPI0036E72BE0
MKKSFMLFGLLLLVLVLVACGGTTNESTENMEPVSGDNDAAATTQEKLKFRASSGVPDKHFWYRGMFKPLTDAVAADTNDQITFDVFNAGELVELGNEYDALLSGQIDIALTLMPPYDPARFPYTEAVMLPLLSSDAEIAQKAFANVMSSDRAIKDGKTYYELEFGDKGLVAFANPPTEPYVFSTTKTNFESVSDFTQSIRIRTASRVHEILSKELGITGQSLPISDAYDALSRNALDGILYNAPDWIAFGLDEVIKYTITGANFGHFVGHTAMTESTWNKLTPEVQEIFQKRALEAAAGGATLTKSETQQNIDSNIAKGGKIIEFDDVNPEVKSLIEEAIVNSWTQWISNLEAQGHAGKEMALLWRDELVKVGATLPQEIMDL